MLSYTKPILLLLVLVFGLSSWKSPEPRPTFDLNQVDAMSAHILGQGDASAVSSFKVHSLNVAKVTLLLTSTHFSYRPFSPSIILNPGNNFLHEIFRPPILA